MLIAEYLEWLFTLEWLGEGRSRRYQKTAALRDAVCFRRICALLRLQGLALVPAGL